MKNFKYIYTFATIKTDRIKSIIIIFYKIIEKNNISYMNLHSSNSKSKKDQSAPRSVQQITREKKTQDQIQKLTRGHLNKALEFYGDFQEDLAKNMKKELDEIKTILNVQLQRTIKKLENKLRNSYSKSMAETLTSFYLQPFVAGEVEEVYKAISKLKDKIYSYINDFCNNVLSRNIKKSNELSLYHFSNEIKSLDKNWNSVSSRSPLNIAQITVKGFYRPQTTWLALGVTKKMKQFGPVNGSFNKEDFMGNIYLNGSDQMAGGFKLRKDLMNNDVFIIECQNRMVWVYRKSEGKNKKEVFIMDDNMEYYIYIGIKGPIQLKFQAQ